MVIFDANFLLLMLDPSVDVPIDPTTNLPISKAKERVEHLVGSLTAQKEAIGIPTPVIAEILVHAGQAGPDYLATIGSSSRFRILPFDLRAAVEVAAMTETAIAGGDKKSGSTAPWQKVKIDRQIAAIAIMERATTLYSDDDGIVRLAKVAGLRTVSSWELPLPPEDPQGSLDV
jgi:predicted nucleic acid-binding protein